MRSWMKWGEIARDLSIQAKVLLSAVTIILLLNEDDTLVYGNSRSPIFTYCVEAPGGYVVKEAEILLESAREVCQPRTSMSSVRSWLIALIAVNQLLFLLAVFLKYRRPLLHHSWTISVLVAAAAMTLAIVKIVLVLSATLVSVSVPCAQWITEPGVETTGMCHFTEMSFNLAHHLGVECYENPLAPKCMSCDVSLACNFGVQVGEEVFFLSASFILSGFYILQCLFEYMDDDEAVTSQVAQTRVEMVQLAELAKQDAGDLSNWRGEGVQDVGMLRRANVLRKRRLEMASKRRFYRIVQDVATASKLVVVLVSLSVLLANPSVQCNSVLDDKGHVVRTGAEMAEDCSPLLGENAWMYVYVYVWLGVSSVFAFAALSAFDKVLWFHNHSTLVATAFLGLLASITFAQVLSLSQFYAQDVFFKCKVGEQAGAVSGMDSLCEHSMADSFPQYDCGLQCRSKAPAVVYTLGTSVFLSLVYQLFLVRRYMAQSTRMMASATEWYRR